MNEKIYNRFLNKIIEIEDYEIVCPFCFGCGNVLIKKEFKKRVNFLKCVKCEGRGKLDWIDIAMKGEK